MKHKNNGKCERCDEIFDRYPGFDKLLRGWFKYVQQSHPEAHISCAGRGSQDQEAVFIKGASKARWKESAHNWNAAIDIFEQGGKDPVDIYEKAWFKEVVAKNLIDGLVWYGAPNAEFKELPHVQLADWKQLAKTNRLKLVE